MEPRKYIESNGVRITVQRDKAVVSVVAELPDRPLQVEVDYLGVRQTEGPMNPSGPDWTLIPPLGSQVDITHCTIRIKDGEFVLCEWKGGSKFITQQCGWLPCVACKDSKLRPGSMWVGHSRAGIDQWITCPECRGTAVVPQYRYYDPYTGLEIDYERQDNRLTVA